MNGGYELYNIGKQNYSSQKHYTEMVLYIVYTYNVIGRNCSFYSCTCMCISRDDGVEFNVKASQKLLSNLLLQLKGFSRITLNSLRNAVSLVLYSVSKYRMSFNTRNADHTFKFAIMTMCDGVLLWVTKQFPQPFQIHSVTESSPRHEELKVSNTGTYTYFFHYYHFSNTDMGHDA